MNWYEDLAICLLPHDEFSKLMSLHSLGHFVSRWTGRRDCRHAT